MDATSLGVEKLLKKEKTHPFKWLYLGYGGRKLLGGYAVDQTNRPDP